MNKIVIMAYKHYLGNKNYGYSRLDVGIVRLLQFINEYKIKENVNRN